MEGLLTTNINILSSTAPVVASVCNALIYESFHLDSSFSAHSQGTQIKLVYQGHRIKVKVTGAKRVQNPYSCNEKLRSAITPFLSNTEPCSLHDAWIFGWRDKWCDRNLCHVTRSDLELNARIRG